MTEPTFQSNRETRTRASWIALAAITVGLGVVASGCAHDDYYCDSTGCFACDGVSCRPVPAPSRTPCTGNWACPSGQTCTNLGCVAGCTDTSMCPRGTVCTVSDGGVGQCLNPMEHPTPNPGTCHTNADCGGGTTCINGTCTATHTPACMQTTDCPMGNVCINGSCTAQSNTCTFSDQCGAGRVCVNSQCLSQCGSGGTACPTGETCVAQGGTMVCVIPPSGCTVDSQCAAGQRCVNATCEATCTPGGAACPTGEYCSDNNVCILDTRPHPFCSSDADCASGSACVGGVCHVRCSTDLQCQMTDVTYRNCGMLSGYTQMICLTDNEFHPTCTHQSDCASGQSCVDGTCH